MTPPAIPQAMVDAAQAVLTPYAVPDHNLRIALLAALAECPAAWIYHLRADLEGKEMKSEPQAWLDVIAERQRQMSVEGWTPEHDDGHRNGEIAAAAATYAFSAAIADRYFAADPIGFWPWDVEWFKPSTPRRDLVKAAALILAEIERLDRLSPSKD